MKYLMLFVLLVCAASCGKADGNAPGSSTTNNGAIPSLSAKCGTANCMSH